MAGAKNARLVSAVVADDLARVLVALEAGASARARRERDGWSVLHLAALSGSTTIAGLLIDGGADLDAVAVTRETVDRSVYEGSVTPLLLALREAHEPLALLLLERGAAVDHEDAFSKENALFLAAQQGFETVVARLLSQSPKLEGRNAFAQQSALDVAVERGHTKIVQRLLAAGAPVEPRALSEASRRGNLALATLLVESGGDVNAVDASSEPPLIAAASGGHTAMIEWLVARGANLRAHGSDALHEAANNGHAGSIRCLVALGVNVDTRCDTNWTPLMSAAWQGHAEATRALLAAGADPTLRDSEGKTALVWARASQRRQAIPLLEAIE